MSTLGSYPTRTFKESQKFLVLDPETQSTSLVLGRDLVEYITPQSTYVFAEQSRAVAQNEDYQLGSLIQTAGDVTAGDSFAGTFLVVPGGDGDFPMANGNDLLIIRGDVLLREQLASSDAGEGSDLVAYTGTAETVTEALGKRTIYVGSVAELKSQTVLNGLTAIVTSEKPYQFSFDSSNLSAQVSGDSLEAVYIAPDSDPTGASGAWVRVGEGFGFFGDGVRDANSLSGDDPHWLEVTNNPGDGASGNQLFRMNSYGDIAYGNNIHSCRYYGSEDAPAAIQSGAFIMSWGFRGYYGPGLSNSSAAFQCRATEDWGVGAVGSKFQFECTPSGSTIRQKILDIKAQSVGVGMSEATEGWDANYRLVEMAGKGSGIRGNASQVEMAVSNNAFFDTSYKYGADGFAQLYIQDNLGQHVFQTAGSGLAGGALTFQTTLQIDANGNTLASSPTGTGFHKIQKTVATDAGNLVFGVGEPSALSVFYAVSGTGSNPANSALRINKDAVTNRSINAAGTLNASGADYAEYMRKADGCGEIAKGDVLGIDADGQLTDQFDAALSFAIKSTDPSYVGGDVWGSEDALGRKEPQQPTFDIDDLQKTREAEEQAALAQLNEAKAAGDDSAVSTFNAEAERIAAKFDAAVAERSSQYDADMAKFRTDMAEFKQVLEAERQHWDRVAFSGRVPVNAQGATPGDYLVPVRGGSGSIDVKAVKSPTLDQYMIAVGKVASTQKDGRPVVLVKIA